MLQIHQDEWKYFTELINKGTKCITITRKKDTTSKDTNLIKKYIKENISHKDKSKGRCEEDMMKIRFM